MPVISEFPGYCSGRKLTADLNWLSLGSLRIVAMSGGKLELGGGWVGAEGAGVLTPMELGII